MDAPGSSKLTPARWKNAWSASVFLLAEGAEPPDVPAPGANGSIATEDAELSPKPVKRMTVPAEMGKNSVTVL